MGAGMRALVGAVVYFIIVFAVGTVLGIVRTLAIAPRTGPTAAVMIELPVMLAASWWLCGRVLNRVRVPSRIGDRVLMGSVAVLLLWSAEALLAVALEGGLGQFVRSFATPAGIMGLVAQITFAAFPLLRLGNDRASARPRR